MGNESDAPDDGVEAARTALDERIASTQRELKKVQSDLDDVYGELEGAGPDAPASLSSQQRRLEDRARALTQRLADLQSRVTDLEVEQLQAGQGRAQQVSPAYLLEEPLAPKPLQAAAAGALAGLFLASGLIAYLTWRWRV